MPTSQLLWRTHWTIRLNCALTLHMLTQLNGNAPGVSQKDVLYQFFQFKIKKQGETVGNISVIESENTDLALMKVIYYQAPSSREQGLGKHQTGKAMGKQRRLLLVCYHRASDLGRQQWCCYHTDMLGEAMRCTIKNVIILWGRIKRGVRLQWLMCWFLPLSFLMYVWKLLYSTLQEGNLVPRGERIVKLLYAVRKESVHCRLLKVSFSEQGNI